jgi:hypothetical protein
MVPVPLIRWRLPTHMRRMTSIAIAREGARNQRSERLKGRTAGARSRQICRSAFGLCAQKRAPNVAGCTPRGAPYRHICARSLRRTDRRFCARFDCRLTRRSVRLWASRARNGQSVRWWRRSWKNWTRATNGSDSSHDRRVQFQAREEGAHAGSAGPRELRERQRPGERRGLGTHSSLISRAAGLVVA